MRMLLPAILAAAGALMAQPKPGVIEGHVFNLLTGAPLRKANVQLRGSPSASQSVFLNDDTDAEGRFEFSGLPPGTYRLTAQRTGFLDRASRRVFTLSADGCINDAEIRLPPQGVISGRVLDKDDEPEPGASVSLFKQAYREGRRRWERLNRVALAGEGGEFRFSSLVPGRYIAQAYMSRIQPENRYRAAGSQTEPASYYFPTYYRDASTQQEASILEVGPGSEVVGIDIRLLKVTVPPSVYVRGRITGIPPDSSVVVSVQMVAAEETTRGGGSANARPPDYNFGVTATPGRYTIRAKVSSGGPPAYGFTSLNVTGDMEGVALSLSPGPEVAARLRLAEGSGSPKLENVKLQLFDDRSVWDLRSDRAGSFAFPKPMEPGRYTIRADASTLPEGFYVQKATLGGQEISAGDFEVTGSAPLDVILCKGAARIAGSVVDGDGKPYPASSVTLVPENSMTMPVRQAVRDDGSYAFVALAPGKYKLFAWEEVDDDLWQDPDFRKKYEDRATEVTVSSGEMRNAQVRLITAEEIR